MFGAEDLFDLDYTLAKIYLLELADIWQFTARLKTFITEVGNGLNEEYTQLSPGVWAHKTARVAPSACIMAPAVIGAGCEIRHCAFLRGGVLAGEGCVIGNSTEVKNSILFDGVQIPHFNYVGDSLLGYKAHMGAGAVISNVKGDKSTIKVRLPDGEYNTGLKKFGALLGDFCEIGCGSVISPGAVIGKNSAVYPLSFVRGYLPRGYILKSGGVAVRKTL